MSGENVKWFKVLEDKEELKEGRVMVVTAARKEICLTHFESTISALNNKCPHQGGPLGEGSIENGLLRCPWHGWDYHPCTGIAPGFDDGVETYPVEIREQSVYVGLQEIPEQHATISDVMVETMINWGVNTVFGMVGHSNLGMAEAFRRQEGKGNLRFIGIRHEGAAAFAASAYGKLTGRPAACFGIAGPGSTNMFTGMWDAKVDRAPLLVLSGQVATQVVGTGNFQEVDLVSAFSNVAAFNHRVMLESRHSELMSLAIKHAIINRDVSHLTFPDEIQTRPIPEGDEAQTPDGRMAANEISPPAGTLNEAIAAIKDSSKPVIIVGHGARFHMKEITRFGEMLKCPILTTFKGKGLISDYHPNGCGVLGRSGTPIASYFMNEADLLIVFGASFSNHTGITSKIKTIQVDFDPMALAKFHKIDIAVLGEISVTVAQLTSQIKDNVSCQDQTAEIAKRWRIWRDEKNRRSGDSRGKGVNSAIVFQALSKHAPENAVMCVDVGNNAYSFGRYFECKQQSFLMSGYLGSIGFALPAAMGAWAAVEGNRPIVAVAGDGGLCQYLAEITTAVKYEMHIKLIVFNNSELGKISKEQRGLELDVWATDLVNPNFADFASSCGALGIRNQNAEDLETNMIQLFDHDGTAVLEIMSDVALI